MPGMKRGSYKKRNTIFRGEFCNSTSVVNRLANLTYHPVTLLERLAIYYGILASWGC